MAMYNSLDLLGLEEIPEYPGRGQNAAVPQELPQVLIAKS